MIDESGTDLNHLIKMNFTYALVQLIRVHLQCTSVNTHTHTHDAKHSCSHDMVEEFCSCISLPQVVAVQKKYILVSSSIRPYEIY